MTNAFSALSLKRNRSTPSKKESKLNAMLNKLTSSFHTNKKRRHTDRRSSLSIFIDYFRTEETAQDHSFANDALFEHNRYQQQKKQQPKCILSPPTTTSINNNNNNNNSKPTNNSILVNTATTKTKKPINHRHTNSTPVIPTAARRNNHNKSHVRHYSHVSCISSSNITVNSEDLTAKEFADIAGIRILSEQDEQVTHRCDEKVCTFCGGDNDRLPSLIVTSRISNSSMIRSSDYSSIYCASDGQDLADDGPQIWDNQFWQRPGVGGDQQDMMPAILHELKNNQDTYLKKGRFEIHLSSSSMASLPLPAPVYEWKRKSRQTSTLEQHVTA
ncbi:hypothetical protein HPULCUR_009512 [Helicostylum pulchrum]|uniref:Uncharacterized protein n=1 Tax=Helicostylum pulchrum TaxID=562976 RepID=A0ABP9YAN8_9FUNG